jgi:hypothetical protein
MAIKKLFFLVFILLILTATVSAYGIREEDIWIFQGAYELGIEDRAYLEGFTLKVHEINTENETSAILLIYRNAVFKQSFVADAELNNEHIYGDELKINVVGINKDKVSMEIYKKKTELVWITDIPKTSFKIGDTLTENNYKISLTGINEEGALIAVEYDGVNFEGTYKTGDYQKYSEDFMINVVYLKRDTNEVFIETLKPGEPKIEIDVSTLKDSYEPDEYVEYELIVTNNGTIPLHGMILTTECDEGYVELSSQQHSILEPGKAKRFQTKVKPEIEPTSRNISVVSKLQGYDYRGNEYDSEYTTKVNVKSYISITKEVYSKDKSSQNPEFGTNQYFQTILTIENKANFQTAVTVTDELTESFIPDDLDDTEWTVILGPGETKEIEYFASPTEPGDFTFSPANVMWKDGGETYTLKSEEITQTFHVSGSKIIVAKELSSSYMLVGEDITVLIRISNDGDKTIEASFQESTPDELVFVKGDDKWHGTLEAGDVREFSYNVRAENIGELYLSATELSFTDEDGIKGKATSSEPFLYIDSAFVDSDTFPEENTYIGEDVLEYDYETPEQSEITRFGAAGFLASSFVTLFCLVAIVPAAAYLYISRLYN